MKNISHPNRIHLQALTELHFLHIAEMKTELIKLFWTLYVILSSENKNLKIRFAVFLGQRSEMVNRTGNGHREKVKVIYDGKSLFILQFSSQSQMCFSCHSQRKLQCLFLNVWKHVRQVICFNLGNYLKRGKNPTKSGSDALKIYTCTNPHVGAELWGSPEETVHSAHSHIMHVAIERFWCALLQELCLCVVHWCVFQCVRLELEAWWWGVGGLQVAHSGVLPRKHKPLG